MTIKTPSGEYTIGGIYEHYKGHFYQIDAVGKLHDSQNIFLIVYHQCTKEGLYVTIREKIGEPDEKIVFQPFVTDETRWSDEVSIGAGETVLRFKPL